jgi:hypothetical protein
MLLIKRFRKWVRNEKLLSKKNGKAKIDLSMTMMIERQMNRAIIKRTTVHQKEITGCGGAECWHAAKMVMIHMPITLMCCDSDDRNIKTTKYYSSSSD